MIHIEVAHKYYLPSSQHYYLDGEWHRRIKYGTSFVLYNNRDENSVRTVSQAREDYRSAKGNNVNINYSQSSSSSSSSGGNDSFGVAGVAGSIGHKVSDFFAGASDALTFGYADNMRQWLWGDNGYYLNEDSGYYTAGEYTGYGLTFATGGIGGLIKTYSLIKKSKYSITFDRYKNGDGFGINVRKNGKRSFAIDYHKFDYNGINKHRWHFHKKGNGRGQSIKRHRPYEGGWKWW